MSFFFTLCCIQFIKSNAIVSEDEPITPLGKKEEPKNKWDDEDLDDDNVKESWEDEDEPAPVLLNSIYVLQLDIVAEVCFHLFL